MWEVEDGIHRKTVRRGRNPAHVDRVGCRRPGVHALPQDERDNLEDYAQEAAWEAARDDDNDHYICGRLTARGIL